MNLISNLFQHALTRPTLYTYLTNSKRPVGTAEGTAIYQSIAIALNAIAMLLHVEYIGV